MPFLLDSNFSFMLLSKVQIVLVFAFCTNPQKIKYAQELLLFLGIGRVNVRSDAFHFQRKRRLNSRWAVSRLLSC